MRVEMDFVELPPDVYLDAVKKLAILIGLASGMDGHTEESDGNANQSETGGEGA